MYAGGRLSGKVDSRILIVSGLAMMAFSLHMQSQFDLNIGWHELFWSGFVGGLGMGLVMLPLNLLAFATLSPMLRTDGTSFYSLSRNIGGSIGISVASAMLARNVQISHADLSAHITEQTLPLISPAVVKGLDMTGMISSMVDLEVNRQALIIAYLDDFYMMMWATLIAVPLVLFMRGAGKRNSEDTPMVME
jgi:DHA2 family multidrug resistance protein